MWKFTIVQDIHIDSLCISKVLLSLFLANINPFQRSSVCIHLQILWFFWILTEIGFLSNPNSKIIICTKYFGINSHKHKYLFSFDSWIHTIFEKDANEWSCFLSFCIDEFLWIDFANSAAKTCLHVKYDLLSSLFLLELSDLLEFSANDIIS